MKVNTEGIVFYKSLVNSDRFTSEMGKMTLEAGRLEVALKDCLQHNGVRVNLSKDSLGTLISKVVSKSLLTKDEVSSLNQIRKQRNYLTHNIYSLLSNQMEEAVLDRKGVIPSDIDLYVEAAIQLRKDIKELINTLNHRHRT